MEFRATHGATNSQTRLISMKLEVLIGILMTTAAAIVWHKSKSPARPVNVRNAAEQLRRAWANNHTIA